MNVTYTTTADQDKGLEFVTARHNAANPGTPETPVTTLTEAEYLQLRIGSILNSYYLQKVKSDREAILSAYDGADQQTKDAMLGQVQKILGVTI